MALGLDDVVGDSGVLTWSYAALLGVELHDWCALEGASRFFHDVVGSARSSLRTTADLRSRHRCPWDLCADGDITGLWATTSDESLARVREPTQGSTLLHIALERPKFRAPLVRWLLSRPGIDSMALCKDFRGKTPLHVCARWGHAAVAGRLARISEVAMVAQDNYKATPLVVAVREEHHAAVAALLGARADVNAFAVNSHGHDGDTPLMLAVRLRNAEMVGQILRAPALDLHKLSQDGVPFGKAALGFAPEGGSIHAMLLEALSSSQAQHETRNALEACEDALGGLRRLLLDPTGLLESGDGTHRKPARLPPVPGKVAAALAGLGRMGASWAASARPVGCLPCWLP
jgi:ankyrin repeat protein